MIIFKPNKKKIHKTDILDIDDIFYTYSHGILDCGQQEFTICGVACEEWDYIQTLPRKKITCPQCLAVIKECKNYKL